jgi:hypothetical protein
MAGVVRKNIQRQLRAGVSLPGLRHDVADVVVAAGQSLEAGFLAQQPLRLVQGQAGERMSEGQREGVQVADAIVVRQAGLRADPMLLPMATPLRMPVTTNCRPNDRK